MSLMPARIVIVLSLLLACQVGIAETFRVEALSSVDLKYMQDQRDFIDQTARRHLGTQLNGKKDHDLRLLQKLLDQQLVNQENRQGLQAMGVILGDHLKREEGLRWVIYIDKYGRSRALAVPAQDEVIFPMTMISRRAEVGNTVNVDEIYNKAQAAVAEIRKIIIVR
jgi:hypothetical protein